MAKYDRLPVLQDLRFIKANESLNENYTTWPFDNGFFKEQIRSFQRDVNVAQRRNYNDRITAYIDTLAPSIKLHMLDENGSPLIAPIAIPGYTAYEPGNIAPNGDPYYTFVIDIVTSTMRVMPAGVTDEIYYFVIECVYNPAEEAESTFYVSEPLHIRQPQNLMTATGMRTIGGWEETQLVEVRHNENDYDILWESILNLTFRMRLESTIELDDATMSDTIFKDQQNKSRTLKGVPGRLYNYMVGGDEGIPPYQWDKLNRMLECSSIRIDNVYYTKPDGAKWNKEGEVNYPLVFPSIKLEEFNPGQGTVYGIVDPAPVLELPLDESSDIIFPCALSKFSMLAGVGGGLSVVHVAGAKVFDVDSDIDDFITYLNTTALPAVGLLGTAIRTGVHDNLINYVNGTDENYVGPADDVYIDFTYMLFQVTTGTTGGAGQFRFGHYAFTGGRSILTADWGDGSAAEWNQTTSFGYVAHEYTQTGSPATYDLRIFHRGSESTGFSGIDKFVINSTIGEPRITGITGGTFIEAPYLLSSFSISSQNFTSANIDTSFLAKASAFIKTIIFNNCNIGGGVSAFVPEILDYPGDPIFESLTQFVVAVNKMSSAQINTAIVSVYNHTLLLMSQHKSLFFQAQTPAAPPTSMGANVAIIDWTGAGYDVYTD